MKTSETYTSITATHVKFDIYTPTVILRYKGIIQVHHGLCEYSDRYERFAKFLSHEGYVVIVSDFPGHGTSLHNFEQGYFGEGKATETLIDDMHRLRSIVADRFPELPFFIVGMDFGSLVVRKYLSTYGEYVDGAILIGTAMKKRSYYHFQTIVKLDTMFHGKMYRSPVLKRAFDTFLRKGIKGNYKTNDIKEWEKYLDDPMTEFIYTNQAYRDILDYIDITSSKDEIKKIPSHVPFYLLSGKQDNFSHHGKDIIEFFDILKSLSFDDIEYKIYDHFKQDILNDYDSQIVYKDILKWLSDRTYI